MRRSDMIIFCTSMHHLKACIFIKVAYCIEISRPCQDYLVFQMLMSCNLNLHHLRISSCHTKYTVFLFVYPIIYTRGVIQLSISLTHSHSHTRACAPQIINCLLPRLVVRKPATTFPQTRRIANVRVDSRHQYSNTEDGYHEDIQCTEEVGSSGHPNFVTSRAPSIKAQATR